MGAAENGTLVWSDVCTLGDLLVRGAYRHPERDCIVLPEARRSYAEMHRAVTLRAVDLRSIGIGKGPGGTERVGIVLPNSIEYAEVLFALAYLGVVAVPINLRYSLREMSLVMTDARLSAVVCGDIPGEETKLTTAVHDAVEAANGRPRLIRLKLGCRSWHDEPDARDPLAEAAVDVRRQSVALRQVAIMFYTSGTTAVPKGCPLTHEALVRIGSSAGRHRMHLEDGARYWDPLPMFHTAFTQALVGALDAGGTYVTMGHFDAGIALRQIEDEAVTAMFAAFPTITMALLDHPEYRPERLARVRTVFNVAPEESLRLMQDRLPPATRQIGGYGLSEFGGSVTMNDRDEDLSERVGDQGLPLPGLEVRIIDTLTGAPVDAGSSGEILVRGPTSFEGYWRDPDKTAASVLDGWVHTGDIGCLSPRGGLRFVGRLKDMLKVGGENVAALEIEGLLLTHPSVSIAAVVAIPDDRLGEVPAAFVELRQGSSASADELIEHCRGGLARFKVPRYVRVVQEWPMSATKIRKIELRQRLCEELGLVP
jgi:fatty-acyl-CoA synthase